MISARSGALAAATLALLAGAAPASATSHCRITADKTVSCAPHAQRPVQHVSQPQARAPRTLPLYTIHCTPHGVRTVRTGTYRF